MPLILEEKHFPNSDFVKINTPAVQITFIILSERPCRARQCPTVHPVSVVEGSQAWRWEAWEPRDSTYNMHLRKSQPENHRHVVEYAFNLLPGRKSERLPCHPCSAWQAPCERAVHLIYPSAPLSNSATSSATAVSFTIEFVQLQ